MADLPSIPFLFFFLSSVCGVFLWIILTVSLAAVLETAWRLYSRADCQRLGGLLITSEEDTLEVITLNVVKTYLTKITKTNALGRGLLILLT